MLKNNIKHLDLVRLIRRTTQIESTLESLGGSGGGIWEKADSLKDTFPQNFMKKIIKIGIARNEAVHGDLYVENVETAIRECDSVLEILENKNQIVRLKKEINLKLNEFHYFKKDNKIELDSDLNTWIQNVKTFNSKPYDSEQITLLLKEEKDRFKALNQYAKKYVVMKKLKQLPILFGVSIVFVIVYIVLGGLYDR